MNFNKMIDRRSTKSLKYNPEILKERFGCSDLLPFWVADMDFEVAPAIQTAIIEEAKTGLYGYSMKQKTYNEALVAWYKKRFDWPLEDQWIVDTPGIVTALGLAIDSFTQEGDQILIQEPVYFPFKMMADNHGRTIVHNNLIKDEEGYGLDLEDFERKVKDDKTRMFILCNPHNPIGKVWSKEDLVKMADLCLANGVMIFADEIHSDLVYENNHTVLANIDGKYSDHVVTATSPSKTFNLAGMQTSHMIISSKDLRAKYRKAVERVHLTPPNPLALAGVEAAYRHGEAWLEGLLDYLKGNIQVIDSFLKEELSKAVFHKPQGTYLAWIDLRAYEKDPQVLAQRLVDKGKIALNSGQMFGQGGTGYVRLNFACPKEGLINGLHALKKALVSEDNYEF